MADKPRAKVFMPPAVSRTLLFAVIALVYTLRWSRTESNGEAASEEPLSWLGRATLTLARGLDVEDSAWLPPFSEQRLASLGKQPADAASSSPRRLLRDRRLGRGRSEPFDSDDDLSSQGLRFEPDQDLDVEEQEELHWELVLSGKATPKGRYNN